MPTGARPVILLSAGLFGLLLVGYVLPPPAPLARNIDPSWQALLTEAFLRHAQIGTDLVFTYGPWGFLAEPRGNPDIYPWSLLGRGILAAALGAGVGWLAVRCLRRGWTRWIWAVAVLLFADPVLVLPLLLVLVATLAPAPPPKGVLGLLAPACALAAHVKFSSMFLLIAVAGIVALDDVGTRRRRIPWLVLLLPPLFVLWDLAAGQRLSLLGGYFSGAFEIAGGYTAAMGLEGWQEQTFMGLLACAAAPILCAAAVFSTRRWNLLPAVAGTALYFFLCFKEAFVRQDEEHIWMGAIRGIVPGLLLASAFLRRIDAPLARVAAWAMAVLFAIDSVYFLAAANDNGLVTAHLDEAVQRVRQIPLALSGRTALEEEYRREKTVLRGECPIDGVRGTADLFAFGFSCVLANDIDLRFRPTPHSYSAYTAGLERRNADYLAGNAAPDNVLLGVMTVDGHYPSGEDSLAWLSLLSHYRPIGFSGEYLLLHRTDPVVPCVLQPLREVNTALDQEIPVPESSSGPVWADVEVSHTLAGRLWGAAYRFPAASLVVRTESGEASYPIVPEVARNGFLLSPVVRDPVAFNLLFSGDAGPPLAPRVVGIRVAGPEDGSWGLSAKVRVRLFRLQHPLRDSVVAPVFMDVARTAVSYSEFGEPAPAPSWGVWRGEVRLRVSAPSSARAVLSGKEGALHIGMGVESVCEDSNERSTVLFRATFAPVGSPGTELEFAL